MEANRVATNAARIDEVECLLYLQGALFHRFRKIAGWEPRWHTPLNMADYWAIDIQKGCAFPKQT